jgi:hypothetical protein
MKAYQPILAIAVIFLVSSCVSMLPVQNHYETAKTLKEGGAEFSGYVTQYQVHHYNRTEASNLNYGFRAGIGLSGGFDIKLKYEHMDYTKNFDGRLRSGEMISIVPKISLTKDQFALMVPLSRYYLTYQSENRLYHEVASSVAPTLIGTFNILDNKIDLSLSSKADFLFSKTEREDNFFIGASIGAGFSTNLNKWALRPELGISTSDNKEIYLSYGIGFQYIFSLKKH